MTGRVVTSYSSGMQETGQPHVNLAYRLDALYAALGNLQSDPQSEKSARELVTLIRASSEFRNMTAVAKAAQQAEVSDSTNFAANLRALIVLMQQEVSRQTAHQGSVLIVSRDTAFVSELRSSLESRGYPVVVSETLAEASRIVAVQAPGVCIADLVLAREDGRDFIADIRNNPATASLLVVVVASQATPEGIEEQSLTQAQGFFRKPVSTAEIVSFLSLRLKRGPSKRREARRDPTTGTPNRAACYEAYVQIQKSCSDKDPISFALFGIHRFSTLVRNAGPMVRESLIRQIGSLLSASFRSSDVVARWGVSEFAVVMPGEDHFGATKAIEKALPALNSQSITTPAGKSIPVTLCAGLTLVNKETSLDEAAATAECHLYRAFHHAWHDPRKNWLISDAVQISSRSESIAIFLKDLTMAVAFKQVLERETFKVELFSSAPEVVAALTGRAFNLLITDDGEPEGEGGTVLDQVRLRSSQKQLRILMVVDDDAGVERALEQGVHDYILKPISFHRLRSQVLKLLWQREDSRSQARLTVMVVDHEISQLMIAGTALHQLGECRVLLAHGVKDAMRRLMQAQPNYLILDMNMPGQAAEELLKAIPGLGWLKGMEVIPASHAATAQPGPDAARKILGGITRPYQPVKFVKEVRALIPMLHDETLALPPVDQSPLEAEVQRILTQQVSAR